MSSPKNDNEEVSSSCEPAAASGSTDEPLRPPAKRGAPAVIEISDTDSDDSDICAVTSYQATADEVKRIRGADYSSSSSSSSTYSSDSESESPWEDDSVVLPDVVAKTRPLSSLHPRADRTEDPKIRVEINSEEVIEKLSAHWKESKDFESPEATLTCEPYRLCQLHNFLSNPNIINNIVDDMNTVDWSRKKTDLFEFHQTADLANLTWQRSIRGIYELLKTDVMAWMSRVTGVQLSGVSASCSLYGAGDRLLPHDDLLGDRRLAFVLYLVPWGGDAGAWPPGCGGDLQLFAPDAHGQPQRVTRAVQPANNKLIFFQVGPETYHQVSEVVSLELPRLSINGWFHGPGPERAGVSPPGPPPAETPQPPGEPLALWVSAAYLAPRSRARVQKQMESDSEVSLREFLLPERLAELLAEAEAAPWVEAEGAQLRRHGLLPVDRGGGGGAAAECEGAPDKNEEAAEMTEGKAEKTEGAAPGALQGLMRLLGGPQFIRLLNDFTDLQLKSLRRLEIQRWAPGDYALVPPRSFSAGSRLELALQLGGGGRGPRLAALAADEEAPLLTAPPARNALTLVYCDAGAVLLPRYVPLLGAPPAARYYMAVCTYLED